MASTIKGLLFDYGGTLDSNGRHWAAVLWQLYQEAQIEINKEQFYTAYVYAERKMALEPIIRPTFDFRQVLRAKVQAQFQQLQEIGISLAPELVEHIAEKGYRIASHNVSAVKAMLETLRNKFPLVMVSNFYGNLNAVLRDFEIDQYFDTIIESAVVGVRKPDPAIYQLGIEALGLEAQACTVIGDSYSKDIVPAKQCGCQTIWLKGEGWEDDQVRLSFSEADFIITDIQQVGNICV